MTTVPIVPGALNLTPPLVGNEIVALVNNGPQAAQTTTKAIATLAINGTTGTDLNLNLTSGLSAAGLSLTATAGGGAFGIANTLGTSMALVSEAANNSTITDTVMWEFQIPALWDATKPSILVVRGNYTLGGGTLGTNTLTVHGYSRFNGGTYSGDTFGSAHPLPATNTQTTKLTFTGTGASPIPGAVFVISLILVLQDTGGSNITGKITNVNLTQ